MPPSDTNREIFAIDQPLEVIFIDTSAIFVFG